MEEQGGTYLYIYIIKRNEVEAGGLLDEVMILCYVATDIERGYLWYETGQMNPWVQTGSPDTEPEPALDRTKRAQ